MHDPRGLAALGSGVRGGTSRIIPLGGLIPPMSRIVRAQMVVHYNSAFNGKTKNQALVALHLMRISEPSLKFQRL